MNKKTYTHYLTLFLIALLIGSCSSSYKSEFNKQTLKTIPDTIRYAKEYDGHLQGIATDYKRYLFWSHTTQLVKTDLNGTVLSVRKKTPCF